MFAQSVHSSHEVALPVPATFDTMWCVNNPNVDRAAPPRPAKRKAAKKAVKKAVKKGAVKKR